jgi:hypothetical protein
MITVQNYFDEIKKVDLHSLPETIVKGHEYVQKATQSGGDWRAYKSSDSVKKVIDLYLTKLNELIKEHKPTKKSVAKEEKITKPKAQKIIKQPAIPVKEYTERLSEEVKFIRRFLNLAGKSRTKEQILSFINSLQKAIVEKRIRKTSDYAEQILFIQNEIIEVYNSMGTNITIELKDETANKFRELIGEQKVFASINFIKRYIGLNGKTGIKEKAKQLLDQINRALDKGKISDDDPYTSEIINIKSNLAAFIAEKKQRTLEIEKSTLNGLEGILGCACQYLNGLGSLPTVMNSVDFAKVEFNTIGLRGKWFDLIGDPSSNFTAMVFGKPKMGKSFLCIEFAGYLARNHGKVLYVAKEEGLDLTLQAKLQETGVQHPNLYVASQLPANLSNYDFIFLDSVSKLGLTPDNLTALKRNNPSKSFICIFQSTKEGRFRGENTFQHDVDVIIEIPERGRAIQMGRFNQGGQMEIFNAV